VRLTTQEYLIKQYLQTNKTEAAYLNHWNTAVAGMKKHLRQESTPNKLVYLGELLNGKNSGSVHPKMDHLVCFLPGTLAIGVTGGKRLDRSTVLTPTQQSDLQLAMDMTRTCFEMYNMTKTGLAPEIVYFTGNHDMEIKPLDAHNLLRPETVESLFVLWRVTGDVKYREWGWQIFQAFEKWSKVEAGYTSLVRSP